MYIDPDIRLAHTLPASFYRDSQWFERAKAAIWESAWLYACDAADLPEPGFVFPHTLLPGVLDEPLLFSRDAAGKVHSLSNVCTHRGKILVEEPGRRKLLSCGYHGRCFSLDGTFRSMPGFEQTLDFPSPADNLPAVPFAEWLGLLFVSLNPAMPFEELVRPIAERLSWLPLDTLGYSPEGSKDYLVQAHWALYCDNYLEGFHIPFVHPALNQALTLDDYAYELFPWVNLQMGVGKPGEPCFDIPAGAPDHGKNIYAYYFWVFPNLMLNFYPWGLSLNAVLPLSPDRTLVRFRTYRFQGTHMDRAANRLDQTELEDEAVVESVQKGIQSRLYQRGRYSPAMEQCVHHFHRLLSLRLSGGGEAPGG